ncbi:MAG: hypothetical protein ABI868_20295, partial [Acidobacteriota bacterium]
VMVPVMDGKMQIPVGQLADVRLVSGPAMLRNENGVLTGHVYVDVAGRDIGRLCHRGQARGRRARHPAHRILARLERPVRGDGTGCDSSIGIRLVITKKMPAAR